MESDAPRLTDRWPILARQIRDALARDHETGLASQVDELRVIETCACGDDFCQSFYTEPVPEKAYPPGRHRNWSPAKGELGWDGDLILDVVDERIAFVEVLDRPPLD